MVTGNSFEASVTTYERERALNAPWMLGLFVGTYTKTGSYTTLLRQHPGYIAWQTYLRRRIEEAPEPHRQKLLLDVADGRSIVAARQLIAFGVPKEDIEGTFMLLFGDKAC